METKQGVEKMGNKYRARGHYIPTGRESWVTTCWRDTKEEAEQDIRCFCNENYKEVQIVEWVV